MTSIFFIAATCSILQLTAVMYAKDSPPTFNLPVIALVFFSLRKGFKTGLALGVFFGLFTGIFTIGSFWQNILIYAAVGCAIGYIGRWFYRDNIFSFICMVFFANAAVYLPQYIRMQSGGLDYALSIFVSSQLCNTVAALFLFYFLKGLRYEG